MNIPSDKTERENLAKSLLEDAGLICEEVPELLTNWILYTLPYNDDKLYFLPTLEKIKENPYFVANQKVEYFVNISEDLPLITEFSLPIWWVGFWEYSLKQKWISGIAVTSENIIIFSEESSCPIYIRETGLPCGAGGAYDTIPNTGKITVFKTKDFSLFTKHPRFTDDSVMTVAICDGILNAGFDADESKMKKSMIEVMHKWGHSNPHRGYGGTFLQWLVTKSYEPYNSWGNGSAMRVSSVGWFFDTLERTREVARWSAEVTHNHPEGVKGAESVASVIWMARNGISKEGIKSFVEKEFEYDLSKTCDEIRPEYYFDISCQGTVPQAIIAFLEGNDFEDVIRTAVSLGGDCDTLTCIAGGMAEAFYGVPENLKEKCLDFTTDKMHKVMEMFEGNKIIRK